MNGKVFLDTNIFVYLYSEDEPEKQAVALSIVEQPLCATSTQVLNEFTAVCLRKFAMPTTEVRRAIAEIVESCELCHIDMAAIQKALALHDKYGYAYYDCLILASAILCGCERLYSEDMQHNQLIEGTLRVVNPFFRSAQ